MSHRCARRSLAPLVCLATSLMVGTAVAGTISISIAPEMSDHDGKVTADVGISNSGDEGAHNVTAVLRFNDKQARGPMTALLQPSGSMRTQLTLDAPDLLPGQYPFQVAVDYTDSNQ